MTPYLEQWSTILQNAGSARKYEEEVRKMDSTLGCFLSFNPDYPANKEDISGPLKGVPIAVKDNIAVSGKPLTCGSRILENFIAPYSATAVEKLEKSGGCVVGKTNLDEFGMGSSSENSALGKTVNPWNQEKVAGGSSGGSAAAVAAGLVPLALGSDTGGSVRQPANFCGIYGLKPTYGSISRYGLTAYASSLEVIGLMTRDLHLLREAFNIVRALDERDQSSVASKTMPTGTKKVAVLNVDRGSLDETVYKSYITAGEVLSEGGCQLTNIDLPTLEYVVPSYYTIATAEASANLARFNGMRYGTTPDFAENPLELMKKARHESFGPEVKLRILLGTFVLRSGFQDQYYGKAQKIRTLIRRELTDVYKNFDLLLMPVFPTQAFDRGKSGMDDYQQRIADIFTCLANLVGIPSLAVPMSVENGLPTGVQLMAPVFAEERLFQTAETFARHFPLPVPDRFLDIGSLS